MGKGKDKEGGEGGVKKEKGRTMRRGGEEMEWTHQIT